LSGGVEALRIPLRFIVYALPIALLVGRNVQLVEIGGRPVLVGPTELIILAGLLGTALVVLMRGRNITIPHRLTVLMTAFSLVVLASNPLNVLLGRSDHISPGAVLEVTRWFEYVAVVPIVACLITRPHQVRPILYAGWIAMVANAAVALYQAATFDFGEARPYGLVRSAADVAGLSVSNPNTAGTLLMIGSLYILSYALDSKRALARVALISSLGACVAAMLFTLSRSSALGFLVGAFVLLIRSGRGLGRRLKLLLFAALLLTALAYVVTTSAILAARLANTASLSPESVEALSVFERFHNWAATLREWNTYLVLGVGFGGFQDHFGFLTPDNLYLELAASTGVLGLMLFLVLMRSLAQTPRSIRKPPDLAAPFQSAYRASLVALLIVSVTGSVWLAPRVSGLFWLLSAIMVKMAEWSQDTTPPSSPAVTDREVRVGKST